MIRFAYVYQPDFVHPWMFEYRGAMSMAHFEFIHEWCEERFGNNIAKGTNPVVDLLANATRTIYMFKDENAAMEFRLRWC